MSAFPPIPSDIEDMYVSLYLLAHTQLDLIALFRAAAPVCVMVRMLPLSPHAFPSRSSWVPFGTGACMVL
jgi:hypothetical protein